MALRDRFLRALRLHLRPLAIVLGSAGAVLLGSLPSGAFAASGPLALSTASSTNPWAIRSIDNMHASRDFVCWQQPSSFISSVAASERSAGAGFATIATPYDSPSNYHQCSNPKDPVAYEQTWVNAIRAQGMRVWFRQTWFNWEGSYGAPKLTSSTSPSIPLGSADAVLNGSDTTSYLARTYHFILDHPALYRDGDIFTPEAEPQNGGILQSYGGCSGPCQFSDWHSFNLWLQDSMKVDSAAFQQIGRRVSVGAWGLPCSNNRWHGADNIEPLTLAMMGVYVTDCYFRDIPSLLSHLDIVHSSYNIDVVVGEWGEIWDTDQLTTSASISSTLTALRSLSYVRGVNYWQGIGGGGGEGLIDKTTLQLNANGQQVASQFLS
jgi:hypothetical protein